MLINKPCDKTKSNVIVYEIVTNNENEVLDKVPIFNCDTLTEAARIFCDKWGIKTSKTNIDYAVKTLQSSERR